MNLQFLSYTTGYVWSKTGNVNSIWGIQLNPTQFWESFSKQNQFIWASVNLVSIIDWTDQAFISLNSVW